MKKMGFFFQGRMIIPKEMRTAMLKQLHPSHLGIQKTKARARQSLYWRNMTNDIETSIKNCETCAIHRPSNRKEPLIPHKVPNLPWQKLEQIYLNLEEKII